MTPLLLFLFWAGLLVGYYVGRWAARAERLTPPDPTTWAESKACQHIWEGSEYGFERCALCGMAVGAKPKEKSDENLN